MRVAQLQDAPFAQRILGNAVPPIPGTCCNLVYRLHARDADLGSVCASYAEHAEPPVKRALARRVKGRGRRENTDVVQFYRAVDAERDRCRKVFLSTSARAGPDIVPRTCCPIPRCVRSTRPASQVAQST